MSELRQQRLMDKSNTLINPATEDEQKDIGEQIVDNQRIIIQHLEILTNTIIRKEDLECK